MKVCTASRSQRTRRAHVGGTEHRRVSSHLRISIEKLASVVAVRGFRHGLSANVVPLGRRGIVAAGRSRDGEVCALA
jgi:hypothetical protein